MGEKPIIFSGEMVRAILDGRKTQTRRIIKPQPIKENGLWLYGLWLYQDEVFVNDEDLQSHLFHNVYGDKGSPYGAIYGNGTADTLWVRETFRELVDIGGGHNFVAYKADGEIVHQYDPDLSDAKWRPSIHMPRWASRLILRLTDIRIERLQDATLADLVAEGCPVKYLPENCNGMSHAVYGWFEALWDSINRKRGYAWVTNPWVWVVEFEAVRDEL